MAEEIKNATEVTEEQELTVEELKEILKTKGLDIGELARQAKALKKAEEAKAESGEIETVKTTRKKTEGPEFEVVLANYPDIVVEKRMATSTKRLIIMPSCEGYYIKTMDKKGSDTNAEILNKDNYAKFTIGMGEIELPKGYWTRRLKSGREYYDSMMKVLGEKDLIKLIKAKALPEELKVEPAADKYSGFDGALNRLKALENKNFYIEFKDDEKAMNIIKHNAEFVNDIVFEFGLNNARDFLNELKMSLITMGSGYATTYSHGYYARGAVYKDGLYTSYAVSKDLYDSGKVSYRPQIKMDYKRFKEYVLYDSVHQGYANSMNTFFVEWNDSLRMQYDMYGKIKEKYSEMLPLLHAQLSYQTTIRREFIDLNRFKHHHDKIQSIFEGTVDDMIYKVPEKKEEMIAEATMQANCLASYIQRFANEESMIVFMRNKETPEESLVTIEVLKDTKGELFVNQAYQARNHLVTEEQYENLKKWANKRKINISKIAHE